MRFNIILIPLALLGLTAQVQALTCLANGAEVCSGAEFKFSAVAANEFEKSFDSRQEKFVAWMKPVAMYVHATTGLPLSITIAQAGLSSEWGTSLAFTKHNNIFKITCWQPKTLLNGEVVLGGKKFTYSGRCSTDKAAGQVGKIMTFASREESFLAYLGMLLNSHSKLFKPVQDHLKHALATVPPRPPSFRGVGSMLAAFSPDPSYVAALHRSIQMNKIDENEGVPCWVCLRDKSRPSASPTPVAAPPAASQPPAAAKHKADQ